MKVQPKVITMLTLFSAFVFSCKSKTEKFEVSGTIKNNSEAKMVYLEEIPAVTMERFVVDSMELGKDGKYKLSAKSGEEMVYSIRLDQQTHPVATILNDVPKITVDVSFNDANKNFPEKYDVKGSPASEELKDYLGIYNMRLQKIFSIGEKGDSLTKANVPDSQLMVLQSEYMVVAESMKNDLKKAVAKSQNPALTLFMLGVYQNSESQAFGIPQLKDDEVSKIIDDAAAKFPKHDGLAAIKVSLDKEKARDMQQLTAFSWIGKQAPDFALPDVNGKEISLSSFKGKYVLVDFWASWCGPCRAENPNVVSAFNKFNTKNFTVLGVSLDKPGQKNKWVKAIMDDGLTWTHVSDLQHWKSPVVGLYGFNGIPFNVLVDPEGKIIAEGLRGPALENKLAEVLK